MAMIDWLVLTAANPAQARGYQAQLDARASGGVLPQARRYRVICDPGGRRVGSGGSTFFVLHELARLLHKENPAARSLAELFTRQRVVVIHSGGDSRRLVAYAAQGKVFTPLPCDGPLGKPATLFDLLIDSLARLPVPSRGQVLLAAGDVLLTFDPRSVSFDAPGVVGVAYPGPVERGRSHGVYVARPDGAVSDFLQKPDADTARSRGAVDAMGRLLVDTGLVSLDPPTAERWLRACGVTLTRTGVTLNRGTLRDVLDGRTPSIDLYEQVLMAMPRRFTLARYLQAVGPRDDNAASRAHRNRLVHLHRALHAQPFSVQVLPYCDFFHIGSSRELLANVSTLGRTATEHGFANFDRSVVGDRAALEGAFVYNSLLETSSVRTGEGVFIEAVHTRSPVALAGRNILVGLSAAARTPIRLPRGLGLVCLPVRGGKWSAVLFGVDDDFKTPRGSGGTFANEPLDRLLAATGLDDTRLWGGLADRQQTLWDARLWCVGPLDRVLRDTLPLAAAVTRHRRPSAALGRWRRVDRLSMADLLTRVDHDRLIAHRAQVQRIGELHRLPERIAADPWLPAQSVADAVQSRGEADIALRGLRGVLESSDQPLRRARVAWLAGRIVERYPGGAKLLGDAAGPRGAKLAPLAFAEVARSVQQQVALPMKQPRAAILPDQAVWVTTPVRLDFHGGWSDTPPICTELGGAVVNAAITLNGQYPVQVMAKLAEEPRIALSSIDLGRRVTFTETKQVHDYRNPHDWSALPKAAMVLAGLCPRDPDVSLRKHLERLGGGVDITVFSSLPKGSGMGTSSILGAAVLACLARIVGETLPGEALIARTSVLEQLMTTGGGWQDQVGGTTPGVKLVQTAPGIEQMPSLHWTVFDRSPTSPFRSCLLLYFTGYKRMARDILHKVVGRYLARDPGAIAVIDDLKRGAQRMKSDLDARDYTAFARGIDDYWSLKKRIDAGATNETIESLLARVDRYLLGKVLPGAGGGGFVLMAARDEQAAAKVRQILEKNRPNALARFFEFDVDPKGLHVTVL